MVAILSNGRWITTQYVCSPPIHPNPIPTQIWWYKYCPSTIKFGWYSRGFKLHSCTLAMYFLLLLYCFIIFQIPNPEHLAAITYLAPVTQLGTIWLIYHLNQLGACCQIDPYVHNAMKFIWQCDLYHRKCSRIWWCHQMEPFSAFLALCAGNSPVPGEFRS